MTRRSNGRKPQGEWFATGLESRLLPATGLAGVADVLRELGPVSLAAATSGVEATAQIDAGGSVTFRFEIEASSNYTLLVRHTGEGLTLEAQGPTGSATINPGPAGPFQVVPLRLDSTVYEVKASARSGQPVFVDWELLLNSGVGQSAASEPGVVLPSITSTANSPVPIPGGAIVTTSTQLKAAARTSMISPSSAFAPDEISTFWVHNDLMGRLTLEQPTSPEGGAGSNPLLASSTDPLSMMTTSLVATLQSPTQAQTENQGASEEMGWLDLFAQTGTLGRSVAGVENEKAIESPSEPDAADSRRSHVSLTVISPGLLFGAVAVTIASRARVKSSRESLSRRPATPFSPSMQPFLQLLPKRVDAVSTIRP